MEWHQTKSDDKEKDDVESAISKHQGDTAPPTRLLPHTLTLLQMCALLFSCLCNM